MDFQKLFEIEQKNLGKRIIQIRNVLNLSQQKFGERCKINRTEISRIETGSKNLEFATIIKLANGIGIATKFLFAYSASFSLNQIGKEQDLEIRIEKEKKLFGERLLALRKRKNLMQIDVDIETGIWESDISRIENALANTKFFSIFRIAKVLKVKVFDLFNYKGPLPE